MEQVLVNLAGKARAVTRNGKAYLVAPLSLLVPGVLHGSQGPLLYPAEEVAKHPEQWNHIPLTANHPLGLQGQSLSARDPAVLDKQGIGFIYKAVHNGNKIVSEGWFDVEALERVDVRIKDALLAGQSLELSTGLYTENTPAPAGATYNGRPYGHIARNYRPDHVAVLVDQIGACSRQDGCGVLVNAVTAAAPLSLLERFVGWLVGNARQPSSALDISPDDACEIVKQGSVNGHPLTDAQQGMFGARCGERDKTHNAAPNQPRHRGTGQYLPNGSGTGSGLVHDAAQAGHGSQDEDEDEDEDECLEQPLAAGLAGAGATGASEAAVAPPKGTVAELMARQGATVTNRNIPQSERDKLSADDFAGPNQSFPIVTQADVDAAAHLIGKAADPDAVKRKIIAIAKRKGLKVPEAWSSSNTENAMKTRTELVTDLVTNCACWQGDEATLNTFDDDKIAALHEQYTLATNARMKEGDGKDGEKAGDSKLTAKGAKKRIPPDDPEEMISRDSEGASEPGEKTPRKVGKPVTANEWYANAPPEVQSVLRNALAIEQQQKRELIQNMVAHLAEGDAKTAAMRRLSTKSLEELRDLVVLAPPTRNDLVPAGGNLFAPVSFYGAQGGAIHNQQTAADKKNFLPLPVLNFAEEADERAQA